MPRLLLLAALFCLATVAAAQSSVDRTWRYDMWELPDAASDWERIGGGHAFVLDGGLLAINDNSNADRIAFQTLVGQIEASHELRVRASLRIYSNLMGQAATLEVARPGLEIIARLFPQQIVLGERDASGDFRWLGQVDVDLTSLHEIELVKRAASGAAVEEVLLYVDGVEALRVSPYALGALAVGRVLLGSLSLPDMGASAWDWIELDLRRVAPHLPTEVQSFGEFKSRFGF